MLRMSLFAGRNSTANYWRLSQVATNAETRRNIQLQAERRNAQDPTDIPDREFVNRYRLTKPAFQYLCQELSTKTSLKSSQRVSLEYKVLCALTFFATGSYQRLVGMAKHIGQTTVSKFVREVTLALNDPAIINEFIKFPTTEAERDIIKQNFYIQHGIPGVLGCIDGSHFHIFTPKKEIEHLFFCRKHYYSINVQMICDSECRILNVNPKYGGATHDAFIWENSAANEYMQSLHRNSNEHFWLLGDSGYPQRPWLMTPIPDAAEGSPEANYTSIHGKARVCIENTFGRLKNRWRCVCKDRTLHYSPTTCAKIITACCVLHNLAIKFSVPEPLDLDDSGESVHAGFSRNVVAHDIGSREDLIRGRAIRDQLVQRLHSLHN